MKLLPLALSALGGTAKSKVTGLKSTVGSYAVMGVLALISGVFFLTAMTIFLAEEIGMIEACLAMGAVFGLLALGIYLKHRSTQRRLKTVEAERLAAVNSANALAGAGMASLVEAFLRGFMDGKK